MLNLGDRAYEPLELEVLLRLYRDMLRLIETVLQIGEQIVAESDSQYGSPV